MTERKIVQLATCAAENGHSLYALCNDGSVWEYEWLPAEDEPRWKRLADIPQLSPRSPERP